jgi:hypothetical protein
LLGAARQLCDATTLGHDFVFERAYAISQSDLHHDAYYRQ